MQIYFAEIGGQIKVGLSRNPATRLVQLSRERGGASVLLLGVIKGNLRREQEIHNALKAYRLKGEWYRDCRDTRATIQNCLNNFDAGEAKPPRTEQNFGRAWKGIFPVKPAEELAARAGCSVRTAEYELSGGQQPSAQSIRALIELCVPPWKRG